MIFRITLLMMRLFYDEEIRCLSIEDNCIRYEYYQFLNDETNPPNNEYYDPYELYDVPSPHEEEDNTKA